MMEHLENVEQELQQTDRLLSAKKKEIESEGHLRQLSERELGRYHYRLLLSAFPLLLLLSAHPPGPL